VSPWVPVLPQFYFASRALRRIIDTGTGDKRRYARRDVDNAQVVKADTRASNGAIHVIDSEIFPQ